MVQQLKVLSPRGQLMVIDVCSSEEELRSMTVTRLADIVIKSLRVENAEVRMVYDGKSLQESDTLGHYNIKHMSSIQTTFIVLGGF